MYTKNPEYIQSSPYYRCNANNRCYFIWRCKIHKITLKKNQFWHLLKNQRISTVNSMQIVMICSVYALVAFESRIRCAAHNSARAFSLLFQLFYKIIPAIYSCALKLVCRISGVFWQAAASHYILCIIIMTIMRVYDRSAATGMFHTLSHQYFPHSNLGLANVLPCRASREFPTSVTFSPGTSISQKPTRYCYLIIYTFANFCHSSIALR